MRYFKTVQVGTMFVDYIFANKTVTLQVGNNHRFGINKIYVLYRNALTLSMETILLVLFYVLQL